MVVFKIIKLFLIALNLTINKFNGIVTKIDPIVAGMLKIKIVRRVPILCLTMPDKMHENAAPSDITPTTIPN